MAEEQFLWRNMKNNAIRKFNEDRYFDLAGGKTIFGTPIISYPPKKQGIGHTIFYELSENQKFAFKKIPNKDYFYHIVYLKDPRWCAQLSHDGFLAELTLALCNYAEKKQAFKVSEWRVSSLKKKVETPQW